MGYDELVMERNKVKDFISEKQLEIDKRTKIIESIDLKIEKTLLAIKDLEKSIDYTKKKAKVVVLSNYTNNVKSLTDHQGILINFKELKKGLLSQISDLRIEITLLRDAEGNLKEHLKSFGKIIHYEFRRNKKTSRK